MALLYLNKVSNSSSGAISHDLVGIAEMWWECPETSAFYLEEQGLRIFVYIKKFSLAPLCIQQYEILLCLEQLSAASPWKGRQVKVTPGRGEKPLLLDGAAALWSMGAAPSG